MSATEKRGYRGGVGGGESFGERGHVAGRCPQCGSSEVERFVVDIEGPHAIQEMSCQACPTEWHDVYELCRAVGIESDGSPHAGQLDVRFETPATDWPLLREQRDHLVEIRATAAPLDLAAAEALSGVIHLLDAMLDAHDDQDQEPRT